MIKLVRSLFYHLRKTSLLWILMGIAAGLVAISVASSAGLGDIASTQLNIDSIGQNAASLMSDGCVLAVIGVALFIGSEYSDGTIRNALLANKSRGEIYFAYAIVSAVMSLAIVFTELLMQIFLIGVSFGYGGFDAQTVVSGIFISMGLAIFNAVAVSAMSLFFLTITRKKAWAIILSLVVVVFVGAMIMMILALYVAAGKIDAGALEWCPFFNSSMLFVSAPEGGLVAKILMWDVIFIAGFGAGGYFALRGSQLK
ncbi:MAG: ABC transporter permease [Corallococcus sp.]|nr:ABC transporter permease [Corallococcus sp.]